MDIGFDGGTSVFCNINAKAYSGDIIALLGVNGIGKSTFLRTLCGFLLPHKGSVNVDSIPVHEMTAGMLAYHFSVVYTERLNVENITVYEMVATGRSPYTGWFGNMNEIDIEITREAIQTAQLEPLQYRKFNFLSDGEKQRVMLARAICQNTTVMLLDEPTAFLDFRSKKHIFEIMNKPRRDNKDQVIVFSTHEIDAALQYGNTFWLMKEDKTFEVVKNTQPGFEKKVKEKLGID